MSTLTTGDLKLVKPAVTDDIDQTIGTDLPNNFQNIDIEITARVKKETGKALSTNDYTTTEKLKLSKIAAEATKVADSTTNGNILVNGQEVNVYDDKDINTRVDAIITSPVEGVSAQEIIDARQGEASLGAKITKVGEQINSLDALKAEKAFVNLLSSNKADITYVNNEIQNMNSQVQGFHASVADLTTAFPTGNSNNYVVTADNYIYRWSGTAWVSTNYLFDANGVADASVTDEKLSINGVKGAVYTYATITNKKANGNFALDSDSDGLADGFLGSYIKSYSIGNNIQKFTVSAANGAFYCKEASIVLGKSYFISALIKADSSSVKLNKVPHSGSGEFERLSYISSSLTPTFWLQVSDARTSGWTEIQVKSFIIVDMTDLLLLFPKLTTSILNNSIADGYINGTEQVKLIGYNTGRILSEKDGITQILDFEEVATLANFIESAVSKNLFDKNTVTKGGYFNSSGVWVADASYSTSDYIPYIPGKTLTHKTVGYTTFWNNNHEFVAGYSGSNRVNTTNANAVFVRITVKNTELETEMLVDGTEYPTDYIPYEQIKLNKSKFQIDKNNSLKGLMWCALGDSITFPSYSYVATIGSELELDYKNYGLNGRSIASRSGMDVTYPPCVTAYTSMDADADIITVFAGVNDFHSQVPLGTISSTNIAEFYGALNVLAIGLIEKYQGKKIAFITPMQRKDTTGAIPLTDYVKAVKDIGNKYGIPVFDMYANCGLYPNSNAINTTYFTNADGLHPNELGYKVISPKIAAFIKTL